MAIVMLLNLVMAPVMLLNPGMAKVASPRTGLVSQQHGLARDHRDTNMVHHFRLRARRRWIKVRRARASSLGCSTAARTTTGFYVNIDHACSCNPLCMNQ
jgi:hypothetical protein